MDLRKLADDAFNEFVEMDEPLVDITNPKILLVAIIVAIGLGLMIGAGFYVVFTSEDCHVVQTTGKLLCAPNIFNQFKVQIFIVTLLAGITAGAAPYLIKCMYIKDDDDEE